MLPAAFDIAVRHSRYAMLIMLLMLLLITFFLRYACRRCSLLPFRHCLPSFRLFRRRRYARCLPAAMPPLMIFAALSLL